MSRISRFIPLPFKKFLDWHLATFSVAPKKLTLAKAILRGCLRSDFALEMPVAVPKSSRSLMLRVGSSDMAVYDQVFLHGDYDIELTRPTSIIDAGANVGVSSVYFALKYPKAKIVAVEPNAENFQLLLKNTRGLDNVVCVEAGVWHRRAVLDLVNPDADAWAFQLSESPTSAGIRAVSIDELLSILPGGQVDLLKIDIEGAERYVFGESLEWLDKVGTLVIELHDWLNPSWGCRDRLMRSLAGRSFRHREVGENDVFYLRGGGDIND